MKDAEKTFDFYLEANKEALKKDKEADELFHALHNGEREYAKVYRKEDTSHDISWVDSIYDLIPHLNTIVENPRSFIKTVNYLVPAELAKRTGPESVIHLATHTQFVKEVDEEGNVIPSKILTSEGEIDVAIYENRFVMTLLRRLNQYVEKRYVYLRHFAQLQDQQIFYLNNKFSFGEEELTYKAEVRLATPAKSTEQIRKAIENSLTKVETARRYLHYFMTSNFMKNDMKGARPVSSPIHMTNLLRQQPDYHACYEMWNFLNVEENKDMTFIVDEEIKDLDPKEEERLDFLSYLTFLDLYSGSTQPDIKLTKKEYSAKILNNADDFLALNDKFSSADFMRVDKKYYEDQQQILEDELKDKSLKLQNALFKKQKQALAQARRDELAAEKLRARKEAEAKKLQEEISKQEEAEKEALRQKIREQEEKHQAEMLAELEKIRQGVRDTALHDRDHLKIDASKLQKEAQELLSAQEEVKKAALEAKNSLPEEKKDEIRPDEEAEEARSHEESQEHGFLKKKED